MPPSATLAGDGVTAAIMPMAISVAVSHEIAEVEDVWRALTRTAIESPGQSFDFIRTWVTQREHVRGIVRLLRRSNPRFVTARRAPVSSRQPHAVGPHALSLEPTERITSAHP